MDIKIKYFKEDLVEIKDIDQGDWIDIPLQQNLNLLGDPFKKVPLGIAMQLPKGYEAHVIPRSSTFKNWGLIQTNHHGVVDESYNGPNDEWFWPCYVLVNKTQYNFVPRGTRLCQFRIMKKQPKVTFTDSTLENNADRGGHGSTGL
jgi:dUTP pyrophosphatase